MKFRMTALIIAITLTLTACSTNRESGNVSASMDTSVDPVIEHDVRYNRKYYDYIPYTVIDNLISDSDIVVVGEVTKISFMTHDDMTYPPPEVKLDKVLCTVYDLNILDVYKGNIGDSIKLKMKGGLEDPAYTNEQVSILGNQPVTIITICMDEPTFEVGKKYLLVLREFEDFAGYYYPVGNYQGVYPIDYTLEKDEDSHGFTTKNVISYFGEDQWSAFKSDNHITEE